MSQQHNQEWSQIEAILAQEPTPQTTQQLLQRYQRLDQARLNDWIALHQLESAEWPPDHPDSDMSEILQDFLSSSFEDFRVEIQETVLKVLPTTTTKTPYQQGLKLLDDLRDYEIEINLRRNINAEQREDVTRLLSKYVRLVLNFLIQNRKQQLTFDSEDNFLLDFEKRLTKDVRQRLTDTHQINLDKLEQTLAKILDCQKSAEQLPDKDNSKRRYQKQLELLEEYIVLANQEDFPILHFWQDHLSKLQKADGQSVLDTFVPWQKSGLEDFSKLHRYNKEIEKIFDQLRSIENDSSKPALEASLANLETCQQQLDDLRKKSETIHSTELTAEFSEVEQLISGYRVVLETLKEQPPDYANSQNRELYENLRKILSELESLKQDVPDVVANYTDRQIQTIRKDIDEQILDKIFPTSISDDFPDDEKIELFDDYVQLIRPEHAQTRNIDVKHSIKNKDFATSTDLDDYIRELADLLKRFPPDKRDVDRLDHVRELYEQLLALDNLAQTIRKLAESDAASYQETSQHLDKHLPSLQVSHELKPHKELLIRALEDARARRAIAARKEAEQQERQSQLDNRAQLEPDRYKHGSNLSSKPNEPDYLTSGNDQFNRDTRQSHLPKDDKLMTFSSETELTPRQLHDWSDNLSAYQNLSDSLSELAGKSQAPPQQIIESINDIEQALWALQNHTLNKALSYLRNHMQRLQGFRQRHEDFANQINRDPAQSDVYRGYVSGLKEDIIKSRTTASTKQPWISEDWKMDQRYGEIQAEVEALEQKLTSPHSPTYDGDTALLSPPQQSDETFPPQNTSTPPNPPAVPSDNGEKVTAPTPKPTPAASTPKSRSQERKKNNQMERRILVFIVMPLLVIVVGLVVALLIGNESPSNDVAEVPTSASFPSETPTSQPSPTLSATTPPPTISPTSVDGDAGLISPVITTNTPRLTPMPTPFTLVLREQSVLYQEPRISAQPLFLAAPAGTPLRLVAVIQREDDIVPWFFITHDEYATTGAYIPAERNGRSLFEATPNPSQVEAFTTRSTPLPSSTPLVTVTASPTSAEPLPPRLTVRYTLQTYTNPSRGTRIREEVPVGTQLQPLERRTAEGVSWVRFEWNGSQRWLPVTDRNPEDTAWWRVFDEISPFE